MDPSYSTAVFEYASSYRVGGRNGTRLIDQVLIESIEASGRAPCDDTTLSEGCLLKKNIEILLEWTIPADYMNTFREANKSVEEILEELAN